LSNRQAARLLLQSGQVEVQGYSDESGSTGATIEAVLEGTPLEIAFNVAFLREALSVIRTPNVSLEASVPNAPGVFKPVGEDGFIHVIMPLFQGG
jgi:DNA polymerase III subunit beta